MIRVNASDPTARPEDIAALLLGQRRAGSSLCESITETGKQRSSISEIVSFGFGGVELLLVV